ncbi:MAG: HPr family phosphocarrier protein [Desulfobacterales bacterium]|nr:MAG: HPr family phosphocarrier protein [Desulfobacterales bacterium]
MTEPQDPGRRASSPDIPALSAEVQIVNELGLHARSAAKLVNSATKATSAVNLIRGEESVDAKSLIDILTLACGKGSRLTISIAAEEDRAVLEEMTALVENGFGE